MAINSSGDITLEGTLTAENYVVSSSVTNQTIAGVSGSTTFGDDINDVHNFTGSLFTSGSNLSIGSSVTNSTLNLFSPDNTQVQFQDNATGTGAADGVRVGWNGTVGQFFIFENAGFRIATNNQERITVEADGDVGIGTTGPNTKLDVRGAITVDETAGTTNSAVLNLVADRASADQDSAEIRLRNNSATSYTRLVGVRGSGDTHGGFQIRTRNSSGEGTRLAISEAGNVGIGTTSPDASLHISSSVGSSTSSLHIEGSGSSVVAVDGTQGRLFSITDELSGSLFSANTISGLPGSFL